MSSQHPEFSSVEVQKPRLHRGRLRCPRCDARLVFDGEEFLCLTCGYDHRPSGSELDEYRAGRRRSLEPVLGLAPAVLPWFALGTAGALLVGATAVTLLLRERSRR